MLSILAYVGPGPGLSMVWALVILVGTVLASIAAVFLWPMRVALKKMRGGGDESAVALPEGGDEAAEEAVPEEEGERAASA